MKVMLLAAGEGKRMLPLTAEMPKCLLKIDQYSLIEHHLMRLRDAGFSKIIINVARWAQKITQTLGNGSAYGVTIDYSFEPPVPLETGGGILHALPLLGQEPFIVVSSDVWTDYPLANLPYSLQEPDLVHLVLVPTPAYRQQGDFYLAKRRLLPRQRLHYTYSGIGVYHPSLFASCQPGTFPLLHLLKKAIQLNQASAELYEGLWVDVGTPERLQQLQLNRTTAVALEPRICSCHRSDRA